jgi:YHS domain-containing protein
MVRRVILAVAALAAAVFVGSLVANEGTSREIPEAFVPFEHMIGGWKGMAIPAANRLKGWEEIHNWAWKFVKGVPVGMSLELKNDKTLARAQLTYDAATRQYRLEGTDGAGKPVVYVGSLEKKALVLNRVGPTVEGKDRITIRPNANMIRYTMDFDRQEPGAPQFKNLTAIGLTKEGESFAAGGSAAELPKCIITGGTANMTVTYQGKTYPICCSGCRDEFNDNPEKYVKKAALRAEAGQSKAPVKAASSSVGKDDGSFDGLVDEKPATKAAPKSSRPLAKAKAAEPEEAAPGAPAARPTAETAASKAVSLLKLGQNLEKSGKSAAALKYYQQIVKEYPETASAKTASARIKALSNP